MFDTFQGLPLHALIVHATVVLLPLMCLLTVLVAVRPRLREKYAWWTFGADVVMIALTWVTMKSGEDFFAHVRPDALILRHQHLGRQLIWFVIPLAISALIVAMTTGKGAIAHAGTALSAVAAVFVLIWVVRVGHAGAEAVWQGILPVKSK